MLNNDISALSNGGEEIYEHYNNIEKLTYALYTRINHYKSLSRKPISKLLVCGGNVPDVSGTKRQYVITTRAFFGFCGCKTMFVFFLLYCYFIASVNREIAAKQVGALHHLRRYRYHVRFQFSLSNETGKTIPIAAPVNRPEIFFGQIIYRLVTDFQAQLSCLVASVNVSVSIDFNRHTPRGHDKTHIFRGRGGQGQLSKINSLRIHDCRTECYWNGATESLGVLNNCKLHSVKSGIENRCSLDENGCKNFGHRITIFTRKVMTRAGISMKCDFRS